MSDGRNRARSGAMRGSAAFRWFRGVVLATLTLTVGLPLWVLVTTSLTPLAQMRAEFVWLPPAPTLTAYVDMWSTVPLGRYLTNSVLVAVVVALLALLLAVPAGYLLARSRSRGVRVGGMLLLATQAMPGMLLLLPLFLVLARVDQLAGTALIGSLPGLVLVDLTIALPLAIWMVAVQVASVPQEVTDAARMDGAGPVRVLVGVIVPMAAPGIAAAGVFAFLIAWGEVLFASVLTDSATRTLPVGVLGYVTESTAYLNQLSAMTVVTSIPAVVAFLLAQRSLVRGLATQ